MSQTFNDDSLRVVTISDFTPGIIQGTYSAPVYSVSAPIGSAAHAIRCYARPGIGLVPFPTYSTTVTKSFSVGAGQTGLMTLASMKVWPGFKFGSSSPLGFPIPNPILLAAFTKHYTASGGNMGNEFDIDQISDVGSPSLSNIFHEGWTSTGSREIPGLYWPNIARAFWDAAGGVLPGGFVMDPNPSNIGSYIAVPDPTSGGPYHEGGAALVPFVSAYFTNRMIFMSSLNTNGANTTLPTLMMQVQTSDIQNITNISLANFFFPDVISLLGSWGSVSTGEFLIISGGGGGVLIEGDMQDPSYVTLLPGITATGQALGPAIPCPLGLIYCTDYDGVWIWNGGNTSQKVSQQVVDNGFLRSPLPVPAGGFTIDPPITPNTHHDNWGNWVFFAGNWVFDCITSSWWQIEDTINVNFQVFAQNPVSDRYFYASVGVDSTNKEGVGGTLHIPIVKFDRATAYDSYAWWSNPIPATVGSLPTLETVELVASNPTSTDCTVTIQPYAYLANQFPNPNQDQELVFTVPANTISWRGLMRCGFTDYNISILIVANNTNNSNQAPIVHEVHLGFSEHSTSAVQ